MSTRIKLETSTKVPTTHGNLTLVGFSDNKLNTEHIAIMGEIHKDSPVYLRVHSECITGEAFGSLKCECGPQLDAALDLISQKGGLVIYLRAHEGRGIGLINKLRAYALQEEGLDTVEANLALGLPDEARDYEPAVEILNQLGINDVILLTNNPAKNDYLTKSGIKVVSQMPLVVGVNPSNIEYLKTKAAKMNHQIDYFG